MLNKHRFDFFLLLAERVTFFLQWWFSSIVKKFYQVCMNETRSWEKLRQWLKLFFKWWFIKLSGLRSLLIENRERASFLLSLKLRSARLWPIMVRWEVAYITTREKSYPILSTSLVAHSNPSSIPWTSRCPNEFRHILDVKKTSHGLSINDIYYGL